MIINLSQNQTVCISDASMYHQHRYTGCISISEIIWYRRHQYQFFSSALWAFYI